LSLPDEPGTYDLLSDLPGPFFRIEKRPAEQWEWNPRPTPRHRFDSLAGLRRLRYAATAAAGAARERYRDTGSFIPASHADHYRIDLQGDLRVLDLRREQVLDALHLDARVSTGYEAQVREVCWQLSDRARDWWSDQIHAIVFTSRTTPETSANVALYENAPLEASSSLLSGCADWLDELVLGHGLVIDFDYR